MILKSGLFRCHPSPAHRQAKAWKIRSAQPRLGVDLEMRRWYHTTLVLKDTLIHTEQMTAEDLVHSTGNSTPHPVINHHRKEQEKEWIHVYV